MSAITDKAVEARNALIDKYTVATIRNAHHIAGLPRAVIRQQYDEFADELSALPHIPASLSGAVKALEWNVFTGTCGDFTYTIAPPSMTKGWRVWHVAKGSLGSVIISMAAADETEAKAVAQADFERRILSALAAPPVQGPMKAALIAKAREIGFLSVEDIEQVFATPQPQPAPAPAEQALARLKSEVRFILNSFVEQGPEEDESWESYFDAVVSGEASDLICAEIDRVAAEFGFEATSPAEQAPTVAVAHPDDQAVDRFAAAMKAKLKWEREERGRGGWQAMSEEDLSRLLYEHLPKQDPVDVANFCMMRSLNGQVIRTPAEQREAPAPAETDDETALAAFSEWFRKNYPGPDTIIHKPDWHAPKIFRAARHALRPQGGR